MRTRDIASILVDTQALLGTVWLAMALPLTMACSSPHGTETMTRTMETVHWATKEAGGSISNYLNDYKEVQNFLFRSF